MASSIKVRASIDAQKADISIDGKDVFIGESAVDAEIHPISNNLLLVVLEGRSYEVFVEEVRNGQYRLVVQNERREVRIQSKRDLLLERYGLADAVQAREKEIRAPMPGLVLDVFVSEGEEVERGTALLVLEAMKMENEIRAASAGAVEKVHVKTGDAVSKDDLLVSF